MPELRKVTLNLLESDCLALERLYGHGWSTKVRQWVHEKIREKITTKVTIEDLPDEP